MHCQLMQSVFRGFLVVPRGHHVVRESPSHRHTLLPVNQQAVVLHGDVLLETLPVLPEVVRGLDSLVQLVLEQLNALVQLGDLLDEFVMWVVVAILHFWPTHPFLESGLGQLEGRVFRRNGSPYLFYTLFQVGDFLKNKGGGTSVNICVCLKEDIG